MAGGLFGELARGNFPLTLDPGATEILVFADQGNVSQLGGVTVTFASGDHKFLSGDFASGHDADVLEAAYKDEIDQAQMWCTR